MTESYDSAFLEKLKEVSSTILKQSKQKGASSAEVDISASNGLSVTVRLGSIETLEYHRDKGVGLTVYFGQKKGSASSSDLSLLSLQEMVEAACHIAEHTEADPCAGLADQANLAQHIPDLDLYYPWDLEAEEAISITKQCEEAGMLQDTRIKNSEGASLNTHQGMHLYANTLGFMAGYPTSRHGLNCVLIASQEGQMERDYHYTLARSKTDLEDPITVGQKAARRALGRLGAVRLGTRQAPVIFSAEIASGLFGHFFSAINGHAIYHHSSFLEGCLGTQIFPSHLNLTEHPHIPKGLGSAPFDAEGVSTRNNLWIEQGILKGYVLNSYTARKLKMTTTGNAGGTHNIRLTHSSDNLESLFKKMNKGLFVTELMGQGVNKVTGDYSRGATGFWIENGKIAYPVHEVTIAGNLKEMFKHIHAVGNDLDTRGNIHTGSVWIDQMTIAGH